MGVKHVQPSVLRCNPQQPRLRLTHHAHSLTLYVGGLIARLIPQKLCGASLEQVDATEECAYPHVVGLVAKNAVDGVVVNKIAVAEILIHVVVRHVWMHNNDAFLRSEPDVVLSILCNRAHDVLIAFQTADKGVASRSHVVTHHPLAVSTHPQSALTVEHHGHDAEKVEHIEKE